MILTYSIIDDVYFDLCTKVRFFQASPCWNYFFSFVINEYFVERYSEMVSTPFLTKLAIYLYLYGHIVFLILSMAYNPL